MSATNAYGKLAPVTDPDSLPFWQACARRELIAQQCDNCGSFRWPTNAYCPSCHSLDFTWRQLGGAGEVVGFVVQHRAFNPGYENEIPLVCAYIRLDGTDGTVVMASNVVGYEDWTDVHVGMRVRVDFEPRGDVGVPQFRPE